MKLVSFTAVRLRRRIFGQLWQLALQFVLGMALNIIGDDTKGASHILFIVLLVLHILNGIGLVEGNLYIGLKQRTSLSWWALAVTLTALTAGVLTEAMPGLADMWSFVMALGFIASAWLNGSLYIRADRQLRVEQAATNK